MAAGGLIQIVIWLVVVGLIFWLAWWFLSQVPIPEPFATVARVVLALIAFIIVAQLLLGLLGGGGGFPRLHFSGYFPLVA